MKNNKIKEKFIELRGLGLSYEKIAKKLKVSKQTLINWNSEFYQEISNLRSINLESLYEQFYIQKEHKIKLLGEKLETTKQEIDKRDLSDVPTDKLFMIFDRLLEKLGQEAGQLSFKTDKDIESDKAEREFLSKLAGNYPRTGI